MKAVERPGRDTTYGRRCSPLCVFLREKDAKGGEAMVTHEELYIFCTLIIAIITLVLNIKNKK